MTEVTTGSDVDGRRARLWLLLILLVGGIVRIGLWWWWRQNVKLTGDEVDYDGIATRLVETHRYISSNGEPNSMRPPLYPGFVAAMYWVFGIHNFSSVRFVQIFISLATVLQVFRLGVIVYSPRIALLAAAIFCFYPPLMGFNNLILTETLFTFFFASTCLSSVRYLQFGQARDLAFAALACGLGALTRSALFFFAPVLILYVLVFSREPFQKRLGGVALFAILFAIVLAPWTIRNTMIQKTLTTVDCMGGRNLMMGNYEHTPMERTWDAISIEGDQAWYSILAKQDSSFNNLTQGQKDKVAMRYGLKYIQEHPGLTLQRDIRKFFHFWQLERTLVAGAMRGRLGPLPRPMILLLTALIFTAQGILFLAAIYGALLLPPERRFHWLFLLMLGLICGMHTLIFGHSRYHLPLIPIIVQYAAAALVQSRELLSRRKDWRFILASLLALLLVASWLYEIFVLDYGRFTGSASL